MTSGRIGPATRIGVVDHAEVEGGRAPGRLDAAVPVHLDLGVVEARFEVDARSPPAGVEDAVAEVDAALDGRIVVGLRDAAEDVVRGRADVEGVGELAAFVGGRRRGNFVSIGGGGAGRSRRALVLPPRTGQQALKCSSCEANSLLLSRARTRPTAKIASAVRVTGIHGVVQKRPKSPMFTRCNQVIQATRHGKPWRKCNFCRFFRRDSCQEIRQMTQNGADFSAPFAC